MVLEGEISDDEIDNFQPPPKLPEGVKKDVIKEAESKEWKTPKNGDDVTVHYIGTLDSGGDEFDSSRTRGEPVTFPLGKGQVIKGWDLGVATMKKGEIAKLTISPEFAYGEAGRPPTIPPSATLVFEVELLNFVSKDDLFGDGGAIKVPIEEGSSFERPKKGHEVCIYMKVVAEDGSVIDERNSFEYVLGSAVLGQPLGRIVDKTLANMSKGGKCRLECAKDYVYKGSEYGRVTVEIHLEEMYETNDVSLLQDGSAMKKQVKEGDGYQKPQAGWKLTLRVEAATDGSSPLPGFTGPKELRFTCGVGDTCDVLEGAALEMRKAERALLTCTDPAACLEPRLGLAEVKAEKVVFTLELVDFEVGDEVRNLRGEDRLEYAGAWKDVGGQLFKAKRFALALTKYKDVVKIAKQNDGMNEGCKRRAAELVRVAELNSAQCYLTLGDPTSALSQCNSVLKVDRHNVKALFRRAKAHHGRSEPVDAERDLDRVLELDPENVEAKTLLAQVKRAQKVADKESKAAFRKMCDGLGKIGFEEKKPVAEKVPKKEPEPKDEQSKEIVSVTFQVEHKVEEGEIIWVSGSLDELGNWDLERAVKMRRVSPKVDLEALAAGKPQPECKMWEGTAELPQSAGRAEYKYVVRGPAGDTWEGSQHVLQLSGMGGSRQRCRDQWRADG